MFRYSECWNQDLAVATIRCVEAEVKNYVVVARVKSREVMLCTAQYAALFAVFVTKMSDEYSCTVTLPHEQKTLEDDYFYLQKVRLELWASKLGHAKFQKI